MLTAVDETLYIFSLSDLKSPIDTFQLDGKFFSAIIIDNYLFLGGDGKLQIFKVTTSITQPLVIVKVINTQRGVLKILRVGYELLLGEDSGYLEVFDIKTSSITHTH